MVDDCEIDDSTTSALNTTAVVILQLLMLLVCVPFAGFFSWQLWKHEQKNPLMPRVLAYTLCTGLTVINATWLDILDPIRQKRHSFSMPLCSFFSTIDWVGTLTSYILLIEILIERLEYAFAETAWRVRSRTLKVFRIINGINWLSSFLLVMVQSVRTKCYILMNGGILHGMGLSRSQFKSCELSDEDDPIVIGIVILSGIATFSCVLYLAWIFVTRLNNVSKLLDKRSADSQSMNLLIQKSSVVGLASTGTFIINFTLLFLLRFSRMIIFDSCLNLIFLFCLFSFGNDLYERMFGKCLGLVKVNDPSSPIRKLSRLSSMKDSRTETSDDYSKRKLGGVKDKSLTSSMPEHGPDFSPVHSSTV